MTDFNLDQAAEALSALGSLTITPSHAGTDAVPGERWFARISGVEQEIPGLLGSVGGRGNTPEQAVLNLWANIREMTLRLTKGRRVRWNGYMWHDLPSVAELREQLA